MSTRKKMQIVDWIIYHLNRNTFPEMKFIDGTKRKFQVPWMHKSSRRCNKNSGAVFKAWAEYKGKEENVSFSRAKINFRMAMKCQTKVREISDPQRSGTKRKHSDVKYVKVYEFIEPNHAAKNKPKKAKRRSNSASSEYSSQDLSSQHSSASLWSTSQHQDDIPTVCTDDTFAIASHQSEEALRFDQDVLGAVASDTTSNPFEIGDLFQEDCDFNKLPSFQEVLARKQTQEKFPKPYCDTRYIPQYESICDTEVPSPDKSSSVNSSPGDSSDDTVGSNFSCYDYTRWSPDLESHCQVANYTGNAIEYSYSDVEASERMINALEQLFVRSFC